MSITVVIPTYNRAQFLPRALQSVRNQTLPADEIIVIDDGSTDNTARLVCNSFPEVSLLHTENHGVSHARNYGIQAAHGDWIALLDSDDEWLPDKLAKQIAALEREKNFKLCHCDEKWVRNGQHLNQKKIHKKYGGWIFERCLPLCVISPSAALIHISVFKDIGLFDENLPACEDYDFWLRATVRYPVLFLPETLIVKYGGHADQLSQKHWGMDRFRVQALEKAVNHGDLNPDYRSAALHMLIEKLTVLVQGAVKRDNQALIECYGMKLSHYRKQLLSTTRLSV